MSTVGHANVNRRELLVGGALALAGLGGIALTQATASEPRQIDPLQQIIPERLGQWSRSPLGDLRLPRGEDAEGGVYDQVLTRYYTSPTALPIMLLIAFSGSQSVDASIHRPEVCYPAAGFELGESTLVTVPAPPGPAISARAISAYAPGRTEQILYWSRIGDEFPTSSFEQRMALFREGLGRHSFDGALVRISTIEPDLKLAVVALNGFAQALLEVADPRVRALLTGRA